MKALVRESTRLTHTDPKAEYGALAVAFAANLTATTPRDVPPSAAAFAERLDELLPRDAAADELPRV